MSLNVFHYAAAKQGSPETLRSRLSNEVNLTYGDTVPDPADFEVLIAAFPSRELLEASPALKALIIPFAGLPGATRERLLDFPHLSVHNAPYNAVATAETALVLLLASAKFVAKGDRELRRGDWSLRYSERPQLTLQGRTVLILGYGRIGRHIAPVCRALGMEVLGLKRTLTPEDRDDPHATVFETERLASLLPQTDTLVITLPETPETVGLIGEKEVHMLPEGALLVNIGRGTIVDEAALYGALERQHLAAAGLDVWYTYPESAEARTATLPSSYPFHELDNVVMSPHKAGWLGREDESRMVFLAQMLNAHAAGQPLPNRINVERGY